MIRWLAGHPRARWLLLAGGCAMLGLMMALAASIGTMPISLDTTLKAIANGTGISHFDIAPIEEGIVWQYRMSRALMAACAGAGLALCGVILQALLRNALAEPYVLGISAGASTGAVMVMLLGVGGGVLGVSAGAFSGAILAFTLVLMLARGLQGGTTRVILAGVAGAQLFNALTAWVVSTSANAEQSRSVMFWLLGSLSGVRWPDALLALGTVACGTVVVLLFARALDAFAFGEDSAASMGIPVTTVRIVLLTITALMTAIIVSIIGAVGFIGLVIPHAARFLAGPNHLRLIPASVVIGANFMVLADIGSRMLVPQQVLPIGVVTALVGAPAFALILYRHRPGP
ncbi:FecCD family ABC transporter permease [Larsenimonas rhizosphaerae]|uniref:Iron ABC transporter permease n=1 Tax=Larsenimonas rhizosphaerae TaxID=2944682 RepID=A0AA41ZM10_9GAMM|nr:iron ABC transporter permease [Larsenimonas rhizosphaerae]MCX2523320.1 iron ABC transporter permease [Larsenimonas rhizosphaerae]